MKICNIDRIIKDPVLVSRLDGYYQDIDLEEYRQECEEYYSEAADQDYPARMLRNLLYHLINRLELLEEICQGLYLDKFFFLWYK